ncbi:hypothetical protein T10_9355 [Trichinella papuae]|uniref:Uncharacterized protein n=1 Tax=Trichinella papuae TaxID=268474 RepID=A0A0V1MH94_9BILA|nr:hypothetical protein T10_9355 [Trichinella papuae]
MEMLVVHRFVEGRAHFRWVGSGAPLPNSARRTGGPTRSTPRSEDESIIVLIIFNSRIELL